MPSTNPTVSFFAPLVTDEDHAAYEDGIAREMAADAAAEAALTPAERAQRDADLVDRDAALHAEFPWLAALEAQHAADRAAEDADALAYAQARWPTG